MRDSRKITMNDMPIQTSRLLLVPKLLSDVRAEIAGMDAELLKQLSADWLALLDSSAVDVWTLGFVIRDRATDEVVGGCGFKGPPGEDRLFAFASDQVRLVRAHTIDETNASTRVLEKCGFRRVGAVLDPEDGKVWRWERPRA
jgi:RimJ/RimL family protein N-acetyltransferase